VFWGLRFETDQKLTARLDADLYDQDATIELKIPVALPYPIYTEGFKRVDGRFEHKGEFYKLVKHKFQNDTLYIVCIRDHETRKLVSTIADYTRLTQSFPTNNEKAQDLLSKLAKDFFNRIDLTLVHQAGFVTNITYFELTGQFKQRALPIDSPPPKG
jgi:hypothetical protein